MVVAVSTDVAAGVWVGLGVATGLNDGGTVTAGVATGLAVATGDVAVGEAGAVTAGTVM